MLLLRLLNNTVVRVLDLVSTVDKSIFLNCQSSEKDQREKISHETRTQSVQHLEKKKTENLVIYIHFRWYGGLNIKINMLFQVPLTCLMIDFETSNQC